MTMLERIARAICESVDNDYFAADVAGERLEFYKRAARNALQEMRDPPQSAIDAYNNHDLYFVESGYDSFLDTILTESTKSK